MALNSAHTIGQAGHTADHNLIDTQISTTLPALMDSKIAAQHATDSATYPQVVNVKGYGAKGDNATDDLAAINAAVAALGTQGGQVYFPPGMYRVSGTIAANQDNVHFVGAGIGSTTITTTSATAPVFDFGDNTTLRTFLTVEKMLINTSVTRTGGAFIRARKTADLSITRCRLDGGYYGIDLYDTQITKLTDLHIINTVATVGEAIRADSSGTGTNLYLTRIATDAPSGAQPRAGLSIKRWDGVFITDTQFNHSGTGFIAEPPTGTNLDHIFAVNSSFDTNSGDGFYTSSTSGGVVRRGWFVGCWFGTNDNNGVRIDGGALGLSFIQPKLYNNGGYGLILSSGTYLTVTAPEASGNSRGTSNTADAILINNNMSHVTIMGGRLQPFSGFANTQRYGITLNVGADNITIIGTDASGNVTGAVQNLSAGTNITIRNVQGYKNFSKGTASQASGAGNFTVAHGLDVTPGLQDIVIVPTSDLGAVSKFYVSNPTSTTFQINTAGAPGTTVTWSWRVEV